MPAPNPTDRMRAIKARLEALATHTSLTRAQDEEVDRLAAEFEALDRARQLDRVRGAARAGGDASIEPDPADAPPVARRGGEHGRALDMLDGIERASGGTASRSRLDVLAALVDSEDEGDAAARYVRAAGDPDYLSAFGKVMRNPVAGPMEWTAAERAAYSRTQTFLRAMSLVDGSGGFLVPTVIDPNLLITNTGTSNVRLRDAFTVKPITTDAWTGVSTAGTTAEWTAEAAEMADGTPGTLTQPTVKAERGDAFIPFSFEIGQDTPNFTAQMTELLLDAKDRAEATAFVTGSGSNQPWGLVSRLVQASKTVGTATADTFVLADVYSLKAAVPARWRQAPGAAFLANDIVYDKVRRFGETTTGNAATLVDSLAAGRPPTLLGRPAYETSEMETTLTGGAGTDDIMVFGDLKQYVVADRLGTTVELVPHLFGSSHRPTGQRGLILFWRTGGDLVVTDAARVLRA